MNPLEVAQQILDEEIAEDAKALFKKNRDEKGVKGTAEDAHKDEDDLEQLDEVEHDDDDEAAASLQSKNVSDKQSMRTEGYHEGMHDDEEELVAGYHEGMHDDEEELMAGYHEGMHDDEEELMAGYHEGMHDDEEELMAGYHEGMHEGFEEAGINYGEEEEKSFASVKAAIEGGKGRASRGAASGSTASQDLDTDNLPENVDFELEEEQIGAMFEGTDLEEDFKFRAKVIFEEAVNDRVREIQSDLQERYSDWASDKVSSIRDNLVERVDSYLNYVITEWVKENELALENGIRNEINESFINGLKTLFETHNISYPDSQVSVVDGLYEQMQQEQLKREELAKYYDNKINEELQKNIELNEEIEELRRDQIIREATEDLPLSQVDRLETLAEDVDFVDENSFAKSMKTLRESYVPSKRNLVIQDDIDVLAEGNTSENTQKEDLSESMQSYSNALSRYGKN